MAGRVAEVRVHGGAVPVERMNHEPMVEARDMVHAEEKLRIATTAAAEVPAVVTLKR